MGCQTRYTTTSQAEQLARIFAEMLAVQITTDQMERVIERNAAESHPLVCHSHDFIDANQVMLEAMTFMGIEQDAASLLQAGLVNRAWEIARRNRFFVPEE